MRAQEYNLPALYIEITMAVLDTGSKALYLITVLTVTLLVVIAQFAFFNLAYFYTIKEMIFKVVRGMSASDYKSDAIAQDFDTYAVNLVQYLDKTADANKRLDVLNEESTTFIDFSNYLAGMKFFLVVGLLISVLVFVIHVKYGTFLTDFSAAGVQRLS